jgi:hypothetical protein
MHKLLTRDSLDVERLLWREQVQGSGDVADTVGGETLATAMAWARLRKTGGPRSWGTPATAQPLM